jgi:UDP-glucose 4-epimerase
MKTIIVTGGAGFIGSHLIERLMKDGGSRVISLDNYFTGSEANHIPGAEYIKGDTRDIARLITETPDLVYHLGEYSRVEKSFDDMETVWQFNAAGTFAVLEFCRARGVKLVYAGSSTKFGDGGLGRNQSPYAWTKASNSELVKNYGDWFGLPFAITYFYNVYGPREIAAGAYATVIGIFKEQFRRGEPITVVSPGTQRRNFTHVGDIVEGLILIGEKGTGDEFGLGSQEQYSILDIAKQFGTDVTMLPQRRGNRMESTIDITKASALGWQPVHHVEAYIADIVSERIPS